MASQSSVDCKGITFIRQAEHKYIRKHYAGNNRNNKGFMTDYYLIYTVSIAYSTRIARDTLPLTLTHAILIQSTCCTHTVLVTYRWRSR